MSNFYDRPILNSPYLLPALYHLLDESGQPLEGVPQLGRRASRFIVPVLTTRKKASGAQASLQLEPYSENALINEVRSYLDNWRRLPNPADWGVPITDNLVGTDIVVYRDLWKTVGKALPKTAAGGTSSARSICRRCCRPRCTRSTAITKASSSAGRRRASACRQCSSSPEHRDLEAGVQVDRGFRARWRPGR